MIQFPILAGTASRTLCSVRSAVCLSRILILVVAIELLSMPFTQGLWSWDKFLHGGQDFELGLLIILTCLCLVLLRVQQSGTLPPAMLFLMDLLPKALRRPASASLAFSFVQLAIARRFPSASFPPGLSSSSHLILAELASSFFSDSGPMLSLPPQKDQP